MTDQKPITDFPRNAKGQRICGANRTKGQGKCQQTILYPNGRCKKHGGPTPNGMASPHAKHLRYSKYMKQLPQLRKDYQAALADPALVALDGELALLTVRAGELLERLGKAVPPPWEEARKLVGMLCSTEQGPDQQLLLGELRQLVGTGADAIKVGEQAWAELRQIVQERTRTAAAEWKRLNDIEGLVTVEQCLLFIQGFMMAAKETVTDPKMLQAFQRKVVGLLPAPKDEGRPLVEVLADE